MARAVVSGSLSPRTPQANGAAAAGRLDTLEWLWKRLGVTPAALVWENAFGAAAKYGQLETAKWMLDRGCNVNTYQVHCAAEGGNSRSVMPG